ncbi:Globulin-1 S allele [Camellia lanceoleosa]|uniref:Globulin-1 S allele n=1 Tax=Camellia lanceoleosa TaxID=1840588 RepID=A0ACC0I4L0_9ERIC|nr:Globulin-1 S allele [Camellia lanceoleosa]
MTTPYYNSRATKIAVVTNGEGYFEMACPHLSSSEFGGSGSNRGRQEGAEDRTKKNAEYWPATRSEWSPSRGVVFIIPCRLPSPSPKNQNLQIVCFNVNALNNEKFPLADCGVAADLWSAGCILAELYARKPIMPGRTELYGEVKPLT